MRHAPDVRRVLRNGRIRTFWPAQPEARTLVIERGRIVALGDDTLAERAAARPAGEWVVTMPVGTPPFFFDGPASLAEGRVPDRHELESEPRLQRREAGR